MEVGTTPNMFDVDTAISPWSSGFSLGFGPLILVEPPQISLRVSKNSGASFGNPVVQPLGSSGKFFTVPTWRRIGYGRDFVFELSWSTPLKTALNGVFITTEPHTVDTDD
jgi:hypothetical protein